MKHLGDITKIDGAAIPPVNVIIGGSPCQDLSIAGKRAGLSGERSGLFMEQLRIIKEMRKADAERGRSGKDIRPRYMVWENVPGAFSSNKGEDFGAVLQETVRIVCEKAPVVPMPKRGWPTAGCLNGMGGIGALHGVYSMHSFGECPSAAVESHLSQILEDSPRQKYYLSEKACQGILRRAERRGKELPPVLKKALMEMINFWQAQGGGAVTLKIRSGCEGGGKGALMQYEKSATLSTHPDQTLFQPVDAESKSTKGVMACMATQQGGAEIRTDDKAPTLTAAAGMSGNNQPVICIQGNCIDRADTAGCNGKGWTEDVSYTLNTIDRPAVVQTAGFKYLQGAKAKGIAYENEKAPTLSANQPDASVVVALENHPNDSRVKISEDNVVQTLSSRMGTGGGEHANDIKG